MTRRSGSVDTYRTGRKIKVELRMFLAKFGLPPPGDLFENAYAYIAQNC